MTAPESPTAIHHGQDSERRRQLMQIGRGALLQGVWSASGQVLPVALPGPRSP